MPKILVIADDFTGAAEIGGIAHLFGLSVRIANELFTSADCKEDAIIIDTNTRRFQPKEASDRINKILAELDLSDIDLIYKKVDSVLRGPIESEIKAIMTATGNKTTVLISANPSKGRIIKNGRYYIDDVPINKTDFVNDPECPRTSDQVQRLVVDATEDLYVGDPGKIDLNNKIIIPDVYILDNFRSIIYTLSGEKYFPAGGADFFRSLLQFKLNLSESRKYSYDHTTGKRHFIIGSKSQQSNFTISNLKPKGFTYFQLPVKALENEKILLRWLDQIGNALAEGNELILARPEKQISDSHATEKIIFILAKAAKKLIGHCLTNDEIFIEGGETASTIIRDLDNPNLGIKEVIADGVVKLEIKDKGIYFIVKPGSYNWSKKLLNAIKHDC